MKRTVKEIELDFKEIMTKEGSSEKNNSLVKLMNELERDHNALIINPTEQELKIPEISLYKQISMSRKF